MYNNITDEFISQEQKATIEQIKAKKAMQQMMIQPFLRALETTDHATSAIIDRTKKCGTFLRINTNGQITGANFCKNRLCPLCQWRLSRKVYAQTRIMQDIVETLSPNSRYIFLTLTIRNVDQIEDGINTLQQGFHRFINNRSVKKAIQGYIKTIEITYNQKNNTWHPHIHMVLIVPDEYFSNKSLYLNHDRWVEMWQQAVRSSYKPSVDIRIIKDNAERGSAIAEISKYAVKPIDLKQSMTNTTDLYIQLLRSTYKRRLRSFGGLYKQAAKQTNIDIDDPVDDCTTDDRSVDYVYNGNDYEVYGLTVKKNNEVISNAD